VNAHGWKTGSGVTRESQKETEKDADPSMAGRLERPVRDVAHDRCDAARQFRL